VDTTDVKVRYGKLKTLFS